MNKSKTGTNGQTQAGGGKVANAFHLFAKKMAEAVGTPMAFMAAVVLILLWMISGPVFHFSDTWQLVINTATTIVTFLMVFLIQNTQNRDSRTLHLKLDELIKAARGASNALLDLDKLSDEELKELEQKYKRLCDEGRRRTEASLKAAKRER
jgi:low affinity Fe/Cu permease